MTEEIKGIIEELAGLGVSRIGLTGGEPFMRTDLPEILEHIDKFGLVCNISTNGTLVNKRMVEKIVTDSTRYLTFSVDSINPDTYSSLRGISHEPALGGIKSALEAASTNPNLFVSINSVLCKRNLGEVFDLVDYAADIGSWVGFQPYHPTCGGDKRGPDGLGFMPSDLPQLDWVVKKLIEMKRSGAHITNYIHYLRHFPEFLATGRLPLGFKCLTGYTYITIDVELNLKPCWLMEPVGNLRESSIWSLWVSPAFQKARHRMQKGECPGCWLRCYADVQDGKQRCG